MYATWNDVERQKMFIILVTQIGVLSATSHFTMGASAIAQVLMDYARFVVMKCVRKEMANVTTLTTMAGVSFVEDIDVRMIEFIHLLNRRIRDGACVDGASEKSAQG